MRKWTKNELTSPYEIYLRPSHRTTPPEIKNILTSPQNLKSQNSNSPLTLAGGAHYAILGTILFNPSINDLFFFIEMDSMHNFADDNTLSTWGETVAKLIDTLESGSNIAIDWSTKYEMIVNPDKFHPIILDTKKSNLTNIPLTIDNQTIKSVPSVELLGIHFDDKLNSNVHICTIVGQL